MSYKEIEGISISVDFVTEIFMNSKEDLDNIESDKRFVIKSDDGKESYYVFKDKFVYRYPGLSDEDFEDSEETKLYGETDLKKSREVATKYLEENNPRYSIENFILEEYLVKKEIKLDEKIFDLVLKMINEEIRNNREDSWEESSGLDIEKEKEYMDLMMDAAKNISELEEFKTASTEMARTMVIKKYIVDNKIQIRNRNSPNEIKALIISYFS